MKRNKNEPNGAWIAPVPAPMQQNPQDEQQNIQNDVARSIVNQPASHTDPNGSYTGRPVDLNEMPEQDADDL